MQSSHICAFKNGLLSSHPKLLLILFKMLPSKIAILQLDYKVILREMESLYNKILHSHMPLEPITHTLTSKHTADWFGKWIIFENCLLLYRLSTVTAARDLSQCVSYFSSFYCWVLNFFFLDILMGRTLKWPILSIHKKINCFQHVACLVLF